MVGRGKKTNTILGLRKSSSSIMSYTPVPFKHSSEFTKVSDNRLDWARELIKNIVALNEFTASIQDYKIDAQCNLEIAYAKDQTVSHYAVIKDLYEVSISEVNKSKDILKLLYSDLEADKAEYEKYKAIYEDVTKTY